MPLNRHWEGVSLCPCGARTIRGVMPAVPLSRKGVWIVRCLSCGLVRTDPAPYGDLGDTASSYVENKSGYYDMNRINFRVGAQFVLAQLTRVAPVGRLLDVGCGPGTFVSYGRAVGIESWGVEINPHDIEYCQQAGLGEWVRMLRVERVRDELGQFDSAVLNHVLEHTVNPVQFLTHVAQALLPGGHIVVAVPDFSSLSRFILRQKWYGLQPTTHLFHFEQSSLALTLAAAGFEVLSIISKTTLSTPDHVHKPKNLIRRAYARTVMPVGEYIGRSDQLIAIARKKLEATDPKCGDISGR